MSSRPQRTEEENRRFSAGIFLADDVYRAVRKDLLDMDESIYINGLHAISDGYEVPKTAIKFTAEEMLHLVLNDPDFNRGFSAMREVREVVRQGGRS